MKLLSATFVVVATMLAAGCNLDPELSEAIADVKAAAPKVCKNWCEQATTCYWNTLTTEGLELDAAREDFEQACVTRCAFRADTGVYVYEVEDLGEGEHSYEFKENVPGSDWTDYFKCLWDKDLWDCEEHGSLVLVIPDEPSCEMRDECHQLLDINMEYEWYADHEACYGNGDEHVWDPWGY